MIKTITLIILTSLLFIVGIASAEQSKIRVYGYFDLEAKVNNKDSAGRIFTFDQHHLNVITIYRIDRNFRVFTEIEWEHGVSHKDSEINGKIYLAKSFVEYKYSDAFLVRGGKFLTPFGIYNEMHDATPTFISTILPHSIYGDHELSPGIKDRLFAKHATGIQLLGSFYSKGWETKYALYFSNGRGGKPDEKDDNANKGVGARLMVTPPIGCFQVGASFYADRYGKNANIRQSTLGLDAQFTISKAYIESEWIYSRLERVDTIGVPDNTFKIISGFYVQASYAICESVSPFVRYEHSDHGERSNGSGDNLSMFGLNYSINSRVIIKNEIHFHKSEDVGNFEMFVASIAVAL